MNPRATAGILAGLRPQGSTCGKGWPLTNNERVGDLAATMRLAGDEVMPLTFMDARPVKKRIRCAASMLSGNNREAANRLGENPIAIFTLESEYMNNQIVYMSPPGSKVAVW